MASFKLKNDCVGDNNGPVHHCTIFDNNHECHTAVEKLIRLPTDKSHADNKNDVTIYDVADNGSGNCFKTKLCPCNQQLQNWCQSMQQQFTLQKLCWLRQTFCK